MNYETPKRTKRNYFFHIMLLRNILSSPVITHTADRLKLSSNEVFVTLGSVLAAGGASPDNITLSKSTVRRHRIKTEIRGKTHYGRCFPED